MSRRGHVFDNPVTGERAVVLTDPAEHPERVLVSHLYVQPGGRVAAEHFHPTLNERFHVLRGRIGFLIDGHERELGAGESAEIPVGTRHDWWQVGDTEAQAIVEVDPGDRFIEVVGTIFGLARDGKTNDKGLPDPLQLAVTSSAYRDVIVFTSPPPALQRALFTAMAPLGRALGREPYYPEYMTSSEVVEPDPEALALLTEDGRLGSAP
jgi:mannose-6-phosphate isomerase-like protein (cupin superfamily)